MHHALNKVWRKFPRKRVWITCLILYFIGQDVISYYSATPVTEPEAILYANDCIEDFLTSERSKHLNRYHLKISDFELTKLEWEEFDNTWRVYFHTKTVPRYSTEVIVTVYGGTDMMTIAPDE